MIAQHFRNHRQINQVSGIKKDMPGCEPGCKVNLNASFASCLSQGSRVTSFKALGITNKGA